MHGVLGPAVLGLAGEEVPWPVVFTPSVDFI